MIGFLLHQVEIGTIHSGLDECLQEIQVLIEMNEEVWDSYLPYLSAQVQQQLALGSFTGLTEGQQYTAHLEFLPFGLFEGNGDYKGGDLKREKTPKLAIGMSYDFNNNAVKTRSNQGSYMVNDEGYYETNISTFFVDAMFKYKGFSFMGEYAYRDAEDPIAKNSDGTPTGDVVQVGSALNLQSGYLFDKNWELTGRYTNVSLDKDIVGKGVENQYTLGLSKYIVGHKLKVQTDVSYLDIPTETNQFMYRLQVDIHL